MFKEQVIDIETDKSCSIYADQLGVKYAKTVSKDHKKENGQFFTPLEIAELMASYCYTNKETVSILDPGCGSGILSCSLVENLMENRTKIKRIKLVAYETDPGLIPIVTDAYKNLADKCAGKGIALSYKIVDKDFILENAHCLNESKSLFDSQVDLFDIVISNPPYFKLSKDDKRAIAGQTVVNGHPNIYSIFMAISARMLEENGELIFITPRSYASGNYFRKFREYFFNLIELEKVHLFVSRKDTFDRDSVLQETVIIKGVRKNTIDSDKTVKIFSSHGLKDIKSPDHISLKLIDVIDISSNESILYLPINNEESLIMKRFKNWNGSLNKYNIQISTGPVVAFRARDYIVEDEKDIPEIGSHVPLFWLHNVKKMELEWPIIKPNKGQYIVSRKESRTLLIQNKNYILLRRFSSKDDKSRLVAAPYFCNYVQADLIGVENKVNYIYRPKGHLDRFEVVGLCALLNSKLFDDYFRIFNGNVNVSATELRDMTLPPLETIKEIGKMIMKSNDFSVENADEIVNSQFKF